MQTVFVLLLIIMTNRGTAIDSSLRYDTAEQCLAQAQIIAARLRDAALVYANCAEQRR